MRAHSYEMVWSVQEYCRGYPPPDIFQRRGGLGYRSPERMAATPEGYKQITLLNTTSDSPATWTKKIPSTRDSSVSGIIPTRSMLSVLQWGLFCKSRRSITLFPWTSIKCSIALSCRLYWRQLLRLERRGTLSELRDEYSLVWRRKKTAATRIPAGFSFSSDLVEHTVRRYPSTPRSSSLLCRWYSSGGGKNSGPVVANSTVQALLVGKTGVLLYKKELESSSFVC